LLFEFVPTFYFWNSEICLDKEVNIFSNHINGTSHIIDSLHKVINKHRITQYVQLYATAFKVWYSMKEISDFIVFRNRLPEAY